MNFTLVDKTFLVQFKIKKASISNTFRNSDLKIKEIDYHLYKVVPYRISNKKIFVVHNAISKTLRDNHLRI